MVSTSGVKASIGIITGPTASGKTAFALEMAAAARDATSPIEIINADSLLVYRGMNIGTAKPTPEELTRVRHHLIDVRDPDQAYNAGDFVRDVEATIAEIRSRGARPLIVGGTGFYLKALIYGMWEQAKSDPALRAELEREDNPTLYRSLLARDEKAALRIGVNDRYRLIRAHELLRLTGKTPSELEAETEQRPADPRFALWIIDRDPADLERRIELRTRAMLTDGLLEEFRSLETRYPGAPPLSSVGYAEVREHLAGRVPAGRKIRAGLAGLEDEIRLATRQLVKRQRTWFRGQTEGQWFKLDAEREALQRAFRAIYG